MNSLVRAVALLLGLLGFGAAAGDAASAAPRRIASLNLASDEILVDLVPPERLVAVTAAADDPATSSIVGRVPKGAVRFRRAVMERLIALSPDLVVVYEYNDADFLHLLERSGLRVYRMSGQDSLSGIRAAILGLGHAVGADEAARRLVARFDARLADLERRLRGAPRPRALYWADPYSAGGDTAIGALIECGGGANVGRELGLTGVQPLGAERAFVADPDVIIIGFKGDRGALNAHPLLSTLRAVRNQRVVEIPTRHLTTLSHHVADACWAMAAALHPERVTDGAGGTSP
jgi:iron complex transport system substrate-binding protein